MKNSNMTPVPPKPRSISRRRFLGQALVMGAMASAAPRLARATTEVWEEGDAQCQVNISSVVPAYGIDAAMLDTFIELSQTLTGVQPLNSTLARDYLHRFATHPDLTAVLPKLVQTYRDIAPGDTVPTDADVEQRILQDAELRVGAEQLIYLWYVSAFFLPRPDDKTKSVWFYGSPEHYERGLLWEVIRAHAPMTPGGPYGYWADAPSV